MCVFVPACCTGELQPLDLSVNSKFKEIMRNHFIKWYSEKVFSDPEQFVQLQLSVVKPLHAKWLIDCISQLQQLPSVVRNGFIKAGITVT